MAQKKRVEIYAKGQDRALDETYHYGLSSQGFVYDANKGGADEVLRLLDNGVHDIEKLSEAAHEGWGKVAKTYDDPVYKTKPKKREVRLKLANTRYFDLPEDEKEKDRVVARSLLDLWQKEHKLKPRRRLENLAATTGIIGLMGGLFFLTSKITGNVIGLKQSTEGVLGVVLLVVGLVGSFFWFKNKKVNSL